MVSLNPAKIAFINSFMIFEATKLDNACVSTHAILDNLCLLGHKMGSKDIQYETPINDGHLKKN